MNDLALKNSNKQILEHILNIDEFTKRFDLK
jgi:hypothetical protein